MISLIEKIKDDDDVAIKNMREHFSSVNQGMMSDNHNWITIATCDSVVVVLFL